MRNGNPPKNKFKQPLNNEYYLSTPEQDKILQRETVADMYTKITWTKHFKDKETQVHVDSLICKPNSNNVFRLNTPKW